MCIRGQPERLGPVPMMENGLPVRRLPLRDSHSMAFLGLPSSSRCIRDRR